MAPDSHTSNMGCIPNSVSLMGQWQADMLHYFLCYGWKRVTKMMLNWHELSSGNNTTPWSKRRNLSLCQTCDQIPDKPTTLPLATILHSGQYYIANVSLLAFTKTFEHGELGTKSLPIWMLWVCITVTVGCRLEALFSFCSYVVSLNVACWFYLR